MDSPPPAEPTLNAKFINGAYTPIGEDHDEKYGVPTLEELGQSVAQKTTRMELTLVYIEVM
jgi:hypothetical protein